MANTLIKNNLALDKEVERTGQQAQSVLEEAERLVKQSRDILSETMRMVDRIQQDVEDETEDKK